MVDVGADVGGDGEPGPWGRVFAVEVDVERRHEGVTRTGGGNVGKETE